MMSWNSATPWNPDKGSTGTEIRCTQCTAHTLYMYVYTKVHILHVYFPMHVAVIQLDDNEELSNKSFQVSKFPSRSTEKAKAEAATGPR